MAEIKLEKLIPYLDAYKEYLEGKTGAEGTRLLSNDQEDYKRNVAEKAFKALDSDHWTEKIIGRGIICEAAVKAVQKNQNLVGRFQVTSFADKVRKDILSSDRILFDLYHEHKEEECFERICDLFGRKYDLLAYLYFILDPTRYLPLRPSIFDNIFMNLDIDLQLSGRCSWENYEEFIATVGEVRDAMRDRYNMDDIDLLDAHSFLWTVKYEIMEINDKAKGEDERITDVNDPESEMTVFHRDYGEGHIIKIKETKVYVDFDGKVRIFPYPEAFDKEYLM